MKVRRIGSTAASALVLIMVSAPAFADGSATVPSAPGIVSEQLVISQLDATGLPQSSQLVTQVTATEVPSGPVLVPTSTTDLRYLDRRGAPEVHGDAAVVTVGGDPPSQVILGSTFSRPLPVALHAEYRVGGTAVDPATVGGDGVLAIRYRVTNTVSSKHTITYVDAAGKSHSSTETVFAPFAGGLAVTVPAGTDVVSAPGAVVSTGNTGGTVLHWNLVLYPPLGNPQQELTLELRSTSLAIPAAHMQVAPVTSAQDPAVGFSRDLLDKSVKGNTTLADGLTELDSNALAVAKGAAQVTDGLVQVSTGANQLSGSVSSALVPGSQALASGAAAQAQGQAALANGLQQSSTGADSLTAGLTSLDSGLSSLSGGLSALAAPTGLPASQEAAASLTSAVSRLADAVGSPSDSSVSLPPPSDVTLIQLSRASASAADSLHTATQGIADSLSSTVPSLVSTAADAAAAANAAQSVYQSACLASPPTLTQQECDELSTAVTRAGDAANEAQGATVAIGTQAATASAVADGLSGLVEALNGLTTGLEAVSVGLRSGDPQSPGVQEGLAALTDGLTEAVLAVTRLSTGADQSQSAASQLQNGSDQLSQGLTAEAGGATALAGSSDKIASGAQQNSAGVQGVADGLQSLTSGITASQDGSAQVADASSALQSKGTSDALASVVKSSKDPAFARAYLTTTTALAASAAPYAAPAGGTARVAYVSEIPASTDGGNNSSSNATAVLGLGLVVAAALGTLAVRRIRATSN